MPYILPPAAPGARIAALACALLCAGASAGAAGADVAAGPAADLLLLHGRVYTVDAAQPWAEAVAVRGSRIVAVGTDAAVAALRGPGTQLIDLQGQLLTPGFIDSHVHFIEGARYLSNVPLRDATSMGEIAQRVARYAREHPGAAWIQGEGFSYGYADLPGGSFHKEILDKVAPDRPVLLTSGMAHAAWANSAALRRAGITRDTPNPPGGEIVRGPDGEPTGWLKEDAAIDPLIALIPKPTRAQNKAALAAAIHEANRVGLSRVDSAGGDLPYLDVLAQIEREGGLSLRISISDWINPPGLSPEHLAALEAARAQYRDDYLSAGVGKFIMDGVIESHTAYLPGGYADQPGETGMRFWDPAAYKAAVRTLNAHGFQVYTHAIGNGAIHLALDAYEEAQAADTAGDAPLPRHRIEHAEAPDPEDIARFAPLGVVASMQPLMIYPRDEWKGMEGLWQQYAGDKWLPVAFALRSFLDSHAVVAFGTDWPIVQLNPLYGLRNAVLRQSLDGQPAGGYLPRQRITIAEAVRAYTLDAAWASRRDRDEGSIAVGKLADAVLFSRNFVEGRPEDIPQARVLMTLVGGKVVYRAQDAGGGPLRESPR
jgi:predicted amidohydrolase YtcJ